MRGSQTPWETIVSDEDQYVIDQVRRLPVPGGWLYQTWKRCTAEWSDPVFIPTPRMP